MVEEGRYARLLGIASSPFGAWSLSSYDHDGSSLRDAPDGAPRQALPLVN